MSVVEEALKAWESYRAGFIAELELIPENQMEYCPADGGKCVRELATHVAEVAGVFTNELLSPDGNYANFFRPDVRAAASASHAPAVTKTELVALLKSTGAENMARLRAAGEALATQTMVGRGGAQSRLTAVHFAAAHEQYHRGQLAIYARSLGAVPMLTQQINAILAKQTLVS